MDRFLYSLANYTLGRHPITTSLACIYAALRIHGVM